MAADNDGPIQLVALHGVDGPTADRLFVELRTACGVEQGSPELNDAPHVAGSQSHHIIRDQTGIPMTDAQDLPPVGRGCPDHRANRGVHAGGIASASEYAKSGHGVSVLL